MPVRGDSKQYDEHCHQGRFAYSNIHFRFRYCRWCDRRVERGLVRKKRLGYGIGAAPRYALIIPAGRKTLRASINPC